MNISFTGTRKGMTNEQKDLFRITLSELSIEVEYEKEKMAFIHGGAIGSDIEAHEIAIKMIGISAITVRPSTGRDKLSLFATDKGPNSKVKVYKAELPLVRNKKIVDDGNILIATPNGFSEELRSGTWATIRYARKQRKKIIIIFPNGTINRERRSDDTLDIIKEIISPTKRK